MKGGNGMDQKKIGSFLKELRKEKDITQEQLAEKINVSGRTVSRWETGVSHS
jgi:transcriptional regulator with XRE-family HTH domain